MEETVQLSLSRRVGLSSVPCSTSEVFNSTWPLTSMSSPGTTTSRGSGENKQQEEGQERKGLERVKDKEWTRKEMIARKTAAGSGSFAFDR